MQVNVTTRCDNQNGSNKILTTLNTGQDVGNVGARMLLVVM